MEEEEKDNTVGYFISLAIGIAILAACGVSSAVLVLIATLVF